MIRATNMEEDEVGRESSEVVRKFGGVILVVWLRDLLRGVFAMSSG